MTSKNRLMTVFAVGILASTVAARAQTAVAPDPNLGPSTADQVSQLQPTPANSPQLAAAPDPDFGLAIRAEQAETAVTPGPQLAVAPDPNLAPTIDEETQSRSAIATRSGGMSGSMDPIAQ